MGPERRIQRQQPARAERAQEPEASWFRTSAWHPTPRHPSPAEKLLSAHPLAQPPTARRIVRNTPRHHHYESHTVRKSWQPLPVYARMPLLGLSLINRTTRANDTPKPRNTTHARTAAKIIVQHQMAHTCIAAIAHIRALRALRHPQRRCQRARQRAARNAANHQPSTTRTQSNTSPTQTRRNAGTRHHGTSRRAPAPAKPRRPHALPQQRDGERQQRDDHVDHDEHHQARRAPRLADQPGRGAVGAHVSGDLAPTRGQQHD